MEQQREIKLNFKGTVKRVVFASTYRDFLESIYSALPNLRNKSMSISYTDEEGDQITISTEFDFENCRQFVKSNNVQVLKVFVESESNSIIVEEISSKEKKEEPKVEKKEEIPEEKKEIPKEENCEEKVKTIIQNSYENIKDFVEKNGGIENVFNLFKDDLHSLKSQFFSNLKGGCNWFTKRGHCWRSRQNFSGNSITQKDNKNENVEEFKKKLEKKLDKSFRKMKEKIVGKMVRKYEKLLEKQAKVQAQTQQNTLADTTRNTSSNQFSNVVHERVSCDGCGLRPIRGIRYKCTTCPNFDFCEKCEETVDHGHVFMKMKKPVDYSNLGNQHQYQNGHHGGPQRGFGGFGQENIRENRCNFFKNMFNKFMNPQQTQEDVKKNTETQKESKKESVAKNEDGFDFDFLVKELKSTYNLELDDSIILEALKATNGDVEKALQKLFS
jgi:hypothetical protein